MAEYEPTDDERFARKLAIGLHEIEIEERLNQLEALPKWIAGEASAAAAERFAA